MGEARVRLASTQKQLQVFERHLLNDIHALERMLNEGWFEIDVTRIGAEQELCLVDSNLKPVPKSTEILEALDNELFTTELAKFNMELNVPPLEFKENCLSSMEATISDLVSVAQEKAKEFDTRIIMTGIVPTIRKFDLSMDNITPMQRYYALCKAINRLRGNVYELRIRGIDELILKHDSPLLEAANTGFQVHLQVKPDEFVKMYNIAQAITGPVLAASTNSPFLFRKRLWDETRVALFQQSVDTRTTSDHLREMSPRVTFGNDWLRESILEIYKEDIVRYRVLLSSEVSENVFEKLESGTAPDLMALKVHNSTVYRWNRPCYGISNGKAHLRIENRVLPSGPTVVDEMANAALWLGLMNGYGSELEDITELIEFPDALSNFVSASRNGLDSTFKWFDGRKVNARDLYFDELLPMAEKGLELAKIKQEDIVKYLGIISDRVDSGKTGSHWMLKSYSYLKKSASDEEVFAAITADTIQKQKENVPVHKWELAELDAIPSWSPTSMLVEECMTKDLFTVQKSDIVQLVTEMMDWKRIRYVAVEDKKGKLIGLITSRLILKEYNKAVQNNKALPETVEDIMITNLLTIEPEAKILDAMNIMEKYQIGCVPVVKNGRLVGIVTEQNFLEISARLLKRLSKSKR